LTAFPNSVQILTVAGFVDQGETLEIMNYNQQQLQDVMDAIVYFVGTLGATVSVENAFNPYAESCTSSTLQAIKGSGEAEQFKNKHEQ
jgi:hypothetical protein